MWMSYGYPNNIRITFNASKLRDLLGINKSKNKKSLNCKFVFKSNDDLSLSIPTDLLKIYDVLYYEKNNKSKNESPEGEKFYVEKGTFNYKNASYQVLKKIDKKL